MAKFRFICLFLFVIFITRLDLSKCQDDEESGGDPPPAEEAAPSEEPAATEAAAEEKGSDAGEGGDAGGTADAAPAGGGDASGGGNAGADTGGAVAGDSEGDIGANDGKCECCDGEGVICGVRLKWCGATGCDPTHLYFCDKNNKKAYEYEQCKHTCLTDQYKEAPDYCSILIDKHFLYPRKEKFDQLKKDFNNQIDQLNKTARTNYEKFQHSFDITPEEKAAVEKQQMEAEKAAKAAAEAKAKAKGATTPKAPTKAG